MNPHLWPGIAKINVLAYVYAILEGGVSPQIFWNILSAVTFKLLL